jgi:hypothetical protein
MEILNKKTTLLLLLQNDEEPIPLAGVDVARGAKAS